MVYEALIKSCNKAGTPLFAGTLEAGPAGVAISYGIDPAETAICLIKGSRRLVINPSEAEKQKLLLSAVEKDPDFIAFISG